MVTHLKGLINIELFKENNQDVVLVLNNGTLDMLHKNSVEIQRPLRSVTVCYSLFLLTYLLLLLPLPRHNTMLFVYMLLLF